MNRFLNHSLQTSDNGARHCICPVNDGAWVVNVADQLHTTEEMKEVGEHYLALARGGVTLHRPDYLPLGQGIGVRFTWENSLLPSVIVKGVLSRTEMRELADILMELAYAIDMVKK